MEMVMSVNYVEMTDEEMMYVDGGDYFFYNNWYTGIAVGTGLLGVAIDYFIGKGISASNLAVKVAGRIGIASLKLEGAFASIGLGYVTGNIGGAIANALDSSGNGWGGFYVSERWLHYGSGKWQNRIVSSSIYTC